MKSMLNDRLRKPVMSTRLAVTGLLLIVVSACSSQQYYEGLKAGRKAQCLEYPEAEFEDCVGDTTTSYEEYRRQREEAVGN